ncbi:MULTISPECIES: hypothetical protein [Ensifer]|jgi:hypothetical protein|uniref:Uncharacterized protein n=1 Tax=Ensifer adhaerens TaxID=106592 RepID=A0ABY8HJK6_ENSAD|nr:MULTISPECIES: hypothetical protein [Ensifer]KSV65911.1 hypothetical protein N182_09215 [Sinorhizobium sp. GL2]KSV79714.1 hypothetical protein N185_00900 [Sinorhizobium sp. GW3]ANK72579.1 hypothetical protein FA04_08035 [Ensifer adhaerens]KDP74543.1 hypothetical protein FA04_05895 [Ensifer adhaerens]KQX33042.1 hypothetical protein ASD01_03735 [Ensifer sp. Root423]
MDILSEETDGRQGRPDFTDEEIRLLRLWSASDVSAGRQLSAQIGYFATPAIFGVYGLATGSLTVVGVAFICILLLLAWGLVTDWRDRRNSVLMQSVCSKVLATLPAGEDKK